SKEPGTVTSETLAVVQPESGERPGQTSGPGSEVAYAPRWARWARVGVLLGSDIVALFGSAAWAYLLWALPIRHMPPDVYLELWPVVVLFLVGYAQAGLYPGFGLGPVESLRRISLVTVVSFTVLAAVTFAFKIPDLYSRMTFAIALTLSLLAVPAMRFLTLSIAHRWSWWLEPVILLGLGPKNRRAIATLSRSPKIGYRPIGILTEEPSRGPRERHGLPVLGDLGRSAELGRMGLSVALLDTEGFKGDVDLDVLQQRFRHLLVIQSYGSLPVEGVQIRNLGGVLGVEFSNNLLQRRNRWVKRALDLGLGSFFLAFFGPVILACALWVKAMSRGRAFFYQERVGLRGRRFLVPKIRTMKPNAHEELEAHLAADPVLLEEWERGFKLKADPRIIPFVGGFLRRWSLDELPQLWSVVRGDMSLVGPRPFPDYHLEHFSPGTRALRQLVRPGVTGLWQVTLRGDSDVAAQESSDHYYIRNWSVWLDLYILARTISAVIGGRGAY
ncbi:MAG: exopolysaccharide biosynthesis polyprenyl glycosylphosphotransferase, partial [Gemmatimonadota bacterium]